MFNVAAEPPSVKNRAEEWMQTPIEAQPRVLRTEAKNIQQCGLTGKEEKQPTRKR